MVCVCVVTLDCVVFTSLALCDNERIRCWHLNYFLASRLCFQSKYSIPLQADSVVRKRLEVEALSLSINTATLLSSRDPMSRTQHVKSKRTHKHTVPLDLSSFRPRDLPRSGLHHFLSPRKRLISSSLRY